MEELPASSSPRALSSSAPLLPLLLLLLLLVAPPPPAASSPSLPSSLTCHRTCVCASNIVSCSKSNLTGVPLGLPRYAAVLDLSYNRIGRLKSEWTPVRLSRLHTLLLSHNGLNFLSSEAFVHVTHLRHLDLSSNALKILEEFIFEPLQFLEVLLLYNNHISQIDRTAFSGLLVLRKLYLSQNSIQRFPLELVKEKSRMETLVLLDVSSNRVKTLPYSDLQALPGWIKNGLFFHNNSLPCSCDLYSMVARWQLQELSSVVDYRAQHTCLLPGKERAAILDLNRAHLNCSAVKVLDQEAYLGQFLLLDCDARYRHTHKRWVLPPNAHVSFENRSAVALRDGGLQIGPMEVQDAGVYSCHASGGEEVQNETLFVNVMVHNYTQSGGLESMKTAYTTLVGCVASVVMVLIYLYLTPCNCFCCPNQGLTKEDGLDSLRSSTLSVSPGGGVVRQVAVVPEEEEEEQEEGGRQEGGGHAAAALGGGVASRRVAFLDAKELLLEQNGRLNPIGEEDEEEQRRRKEEEEEEEEEEREERRRSDAESVSSVCSDTPMVV